jgi:hypothetical protein
VCNPIVYLEEKKKTITSKEKKKFERDVVGVFVLGENIYVFSIVV